MTYCKRCLYPSNHPLNITFDEYGVCSGCRIHEEKDLLDWDERKEKLRKIFDEYRSSTNYAYDCIIPVCGARDSYFIVHTVKNIFKMHPLLVSYNKQYNTEIGIRNLAYLQSIFGCDLISSTVSPERVKQITRETLRQKGSMYWHCLAGTTAFAVQTAVKLKIPLIVWGVHQGCDQVGMFSHLDEVEMTRKYRKEHDLLGLEAEDVVRNGKEVSIDDMRPYIYPHDKELESVGIRGIYLSNYIRWDSKAQHELMIEKFGYQTMRQERTFDTYNDIDCFHYSGVHDYIKFLKWGYGKATDHACREIRLKRMSREEGAGVLRKYQNIYPSDLPLFLEWIEMSERELWEQIDRWRDPKIWRKVALGSWELVDSALNHINDEGVDAVRYELVDTCEFSVTQSQDKGVAANKYVHIGRDCVDRGYLPDVTKKYPLPLTS